MNNKISKFSTIVLFSIFSLIIFVILSSYLFLVFILPKFLNSHETIKNIENYLSDKTNAECLISKYNVYISPKIDINFFLDNFEIKTQNKKILSVKNLNLHYGITGKYFISINDMYIDADRLTSILPKSRSDKKSTFNLDKIPEINIANLEVNSREKVKLHSQIKNFKIVNENDERKNIFFDANIILPKPLHPITISSNKNLYIENNILSASNLNVIFSGNKIFINGNLLTPDKNPDLHIFAKDLNSQDVVDMAIFLHNIADKHKKFLENFKQFTGDISLDIYLKNRKLNGEIVGNNLKAYTVLYNLPVICPKTVITIKDNILEGTSVGIAGTEKIVHKIRVTDLLSSKDRVVNGEVKSKITARLVAKYLPRQFKMKSNADLFIKYHINNQKINVKYYIDLKKGSDLYYKSANLGLTDKNRRFFIHTYKSGDNMYLKEYNYSVINNGNAENIILGDGLFVRLNNKFKPQYITVKTNGYAPVSVIGGIGKYVWGGYFKGNLKYDCNKYKLTGVFSVVDTYFNNFRVKNANVIATDTDLFIKANGTYKKENFTSEMHAKNNLFNENRMKVYNLNLFLDKYKIALQNKKKNISTKKKIDISKYVRKIAMDIENYNIVVNSVVINRAIASKIKIKGSVKNSLFKFNIQNIDFANGKMVANGLYDFNKDDSHIDFVANNIDANIVGDTVFDLPDYVVGIASADFHTDTYNKLEKVKGLFKFNINGGYLPKIGNIKFMTDKFDKTKFFRAQDYTNADLSKTESFKSDIICSFKLNNQHIYDVNLTSRQKALALFINGDYKGDTKYANINLYGKYDKVAANNVRVMHIPLNWILNYIFSEKENKSDYLSELAKIPYINIPENEQKYFFIKFSGNLNDKNNMSYKIKTLK